MADTRIPDAEIAGYMGWRGPGAYTEASLRKIREVIDHVLRAERAAASETKNQELRDVFDLAWNQALSDAAFYVEGHCVDGAQHVEHILELAKPKVTVGGLVLASRPAEVDDEGLPPLPDRYVELSTFPGRKYFTAEQYRQGQRDAVAADRAKVSRAMGLLREARAALETWKDVAPAVSLCADIDKVLGGGGQ